MPLIKFETRVIGPADHPDFPYIVSGVTHNAIHYTAKATRDQIKAAWPDAIIIHTMAEGEVAHGHYITVYRTGTEGISPKRTRFSWLWPFGRKAKPETEEDKK